MPDDSRKLGFIPDIVCTLRKYYHLQCYMATGLFPKKSRWKRISGNVINGHTNTTWLTRVQTDSRLSSFLSIKPQLHVLLHSELWKLSKSISSSVIAKHCNNRVKMIAKFYSDSFTNSCHYCNNQFSV